MPDIKKIQVGGITYSIHDEYARLRLSHQSGVYVLSDATTPSTNASFYNVVTGDIVAGSQLSAGGANANTTFDTIADSFTVDKSTAVQPYARRNLILSSGTTIDGQLYGNFIYLDQLEIGDTILVVQTGLPDRWADVSSDSVTFRALESKSIDMTGFAEKGTYNTSAASADNSGWATSTGTAQSAGAATVYGDVRWTADVMPTVTGEGGVHAHSIDPDKSTVTVVTEITPSSATFANVTGATLDSAGDHTHALTLTPTNTTIYAFSAENTKFMASPTVSNDGVLSWVEVSNTPTSVITAISGVAATAGAHSHSVNLGTSNVTYISGVTGATTSLTYVSGVTVTGQAGTHTHGITSSTKPMSVTVSIEIPDHTHNLSMASHSHTIAHTHSVTLS